MFVSACLCECVSLCVCVDIFILLGYEVIFKGLENPREMFKRKKSYVMLIFGESTCALDDFPSQRSSPSTNTVRQLPGKCVVNLFQTLSTEAGLHTSSVVAKRQ